MNKLVLRLTLVSVGVLAIAGPATAGHQWSNYHWNKGSGELAVTIGDNVHAAWDVYLTDAVDGVDLNGNLTGHANWNDSAVVQSPLVAGATTAKRCNAAAGTIEVCATTYGRTGWLGLAGISISGGHITSGYTKLNDTYYNMDKYNTPAWRRTVMCQEIGHDYGLGHVNESQTDPNTGSCMDYTSDPDGSIKGQLTNEYPNKHDFDMLNSAGMYASSHPHIGAATDFGTREPGNKAPPAADAGIEGGNSPADWGRAVDSDAAGRPHIFERSEGGRKILTHVYWVPGYRPAGSR